MKEFTDSSGGALDIAPVLRVFLRSGLKKPISKPPALIGSRWHY